MIWFAVVILIVGFFVEVVAPMIDAEFNILLTEFLNEKEL